MLFCHWLLLAGFLIKAKIHPSLAAASPAYNVYYGYLHSHTSISDGEGTPAEAYKMAQTAGLDFFGITDHDYYPDEMTDFDWLTLHAVADTYNQDGVFTTFAGFEWTSDILDWGHEYGEHCSRDNQAACGHMTIIGTADYCNSEKIEDDCFNLNKLVAWLDDQEGLAFFNHPGQYGTKFDYFEFDHTERIVGMELWNRDVDYYSKAGLDPNDGMGYYDEALSKGWHIGAGGGQDNHSRDFGRKNEYRMAVLATSLTRDALLEAFQARRFYSTRTRGLTLSFTCEESGNVHHMGSFVPPGVALTFTMDVSARPGKRFSKMRLIGKGEKVLYSKAWVHKPGSSVSLSYKVLNANEGDYFYAVVYQRKSWAAVSSPIFVVDGVNHSKSEINPAPGSSQPSISPTMTKVQSIYPSVYSSLVPSSGAGVPQLQLSLQSNQPSATITSPTSDPTIPPTNQTEVV